MNQTLKLNRLGTKSILSLANLMIIDANIFRPFNNTLANAEPAYELYQSGLAVWLSDHHDFCPHSIQTLSKPGQF